MTTKEALYKLIRISLGNEVDCSLPEDINYSEVMNISELTGVGWLVISGLQALVEGGIISFIGKPEEKKNLLQSIGLAMMTEQQSFQQWESCQKLVELFSQQGITTIGLKGMTVAQWYPNPLHRSSCDFDCFLLKEDGDRFAYEKGNQLMESKGVSVDRRVYVHSVFDYHGLMVENHHYLSAIKLGKRQRRLDSLLRTLLLTEPLQLVMGTKLMTGSPMFNAVFLTHHAHRHLLNECLPFKQLTDWTLFIKNNQSLDWDRFWKYTEEFGMLRFAQSMTRQSVKLLGASIPFTLPEDREADDLLEESMWDLPEESQGSGSMLSRRFNLMKNIMRSRKRYKVFYDSSSFAMIVAYVKGYFFGKE